MDNNQIIASAKEFMKHKLANESTGHDSWHTLRVWKMAKYIAKQEGADLLVVELAAIFHDIWDAKFHGKDRGITETKIWLISNNAAPEVIEAVVYIIEHISYKGKGTNQSLKSIEAKVVQDSDRLDALGAIGIARAFAFGGNMSRAIYNPNIPTHISNGLNSPSTIHHFHDKLLLLKDEFHTSTAKVIAEQRHQFTDRFLTEFYKEWDYELSALDN